MCVYNKTTPCNVASLSSTDCHCAQTAAAGSVSLRSSSQLFWKLFQYFCPLSRAFSVGVIYSTLPMCPF